MLAFLPESLSDAEGWVNPGVGQWGFCRGDVTVSMATPTFRRGGTLAWRRGDRKDDMHDDDTD
jgi:hypothetical protein